MSDNNSELFDMASILTEQTCVFADCHHPVASKRMLDNAGIEFPCCEDCIDLVTG